MKAAIAGGGIGGLAAAICLVQRGWEVTVCEQAAEIAEIGAGVQLSPNATRVLAAMGVFDAVAAVSFAPEALELRLGESGRRVFSIPARHAAIDRWGSPYLHVHRADLVDALRGRLEDLAPGAIRTGVRVNGYQANRLLTTDGEIEADLIVGADGIRSTIRGQMQGDVPARFTGNVAWRAMVPVNALTRPPPPTACVWAGNGRHAVTTRVRNGELVNFVGIVEADWREEGWRIEGTPAQAAADFDGWVPEITEVIGAADRMWRWALFDRAPLDRWSDGRTTLLGDAAHPMLPSQAQGAAQAIEDAWCLAAAMHDGGVPRYEELRRERSARVQASSLRNLRLFHRAGGLTGAVVYGALGLAGRSLPALITAQQDWLYGYDATVA